MQVTCYLGCVLVSLLAVFQIVFGIRCYQCSSNYPGDRCEDPFDEAQNLPLQDCQHVRLYDDYRYYMQTCKKVKTYVDGYYRISRGCAFIGSPGEMARERNVCNIEKSRYGNYDEEICTCDQRDGCNSAPKHITSLPVLLLPMFLLKKFVG